MCLCVRLQRLSLSHSLSRKRTPKTVNLNITKTLRTLTQKAMYKLYHVGKIYYDRYDVGKIYYDRYDGLDTCSCMCVDIYIYIYDLNGRHSGRLSLQQLCVEEATG